MDCCYSGSVRKNSESTVSAMEQHVCGEELPPSLMDYSQMEDGEEGLVADLTMMDDDERESSAMRNIHSYLKVARWLDDIWRYRENQEKQVDYLEIQSDSSDAESESNSKPLYLESPQITPPPSPKKQQALANIFGRKRRINNTRGS